MTEELKQAAQQALEALKHGVAQLNGIGIPLEADPLHTAITALERALTQRPAAQAGEREAFESVLIDGVAYDVHAPVAAELLRLHLELQARESLPTQPAAQATPETVPNDDAWKAEALGKMDQIEALLENLTAAHEAAARHEPGLLRTFLSEADRAGITHLPATFAADLAAATPEPVGEVVYQIRGEAFECPHAWRDATEGAFYATPTADRRILYTRPAPGVPEGFVLVPVEPTQAMLDALHSSAYLPGCYRAMLAAAQAKGGAA